METSRFQSNTHCEEKVSRHQLNFPCWWSPTYVHVQERDTLNDNYGERLTGLISVTSSYLRGSISSTPRILYGTLSTTEARNSLTTRSLYYLGNGKLAHVAVRLDPPFLPMTKTLSREPQGILRSLRYLRVAKQPFPWLGGMIPTHTFHGLGTKRIDCFFYRLAHSGTILDSAFTVWFTAPLLLLLLCDVKTIGIVRQSDIRSMHQNVMLAKKERMNKNGGNVGSFFRLVR